MKTLFVEVGDFVKSELEDEPKEPLLIYLIAQMHKKDIYTNMVLECDDLGGGCPIIDDEKLGPLLSTLQNLEN